MRLLGPVAVEVDGAPLAVDTRKAVALLAYLAVTRRPTSRESVAALLWPEADGPDARGALRRTLSVLRTRHSASRGLVVDRSAVGARAATAFDVDLWRLRARARASPGATRHPGRRRCPDLPGGALDEAAALDRGEFMAGFSLRDSEDVRRVAAGGGRRPPARPGRRARAPRSRTSGGRGLGVGRPRPRRRWLELDPLHEPAHRLLMEVLARSGEPAAALTAVPGLRPDPGPELGRRPAVRDDRPGRGDPRVATSSRDPTTGRLDRRSGGAAADAVDGPASSAAPSPTRTDRPGRRWSAANASSPTSSTRTPGPTRPAASWSSRASPGSARPGSPGRSSQTVRARGGIVLESRAYAGEAAIPLSVVAELLRSGLARPDAADRLATVDPAALGEVARLLPIPGVPTSATVGRRRPLRTRPALRRPRGAPLGARPWDRAGHRLDR